MRTTVHQALEVALDSTTGDFYAFDFKTDRWIAEGNVGIQKNHAGVGGTFAAILADASEGLGLKGYNCAVKVRRRVSHIFLQRRHVLIYVLSKQDEDMDRGHGVLSFKSLASQSVLALLEFCLNTLLLQRDACTLIGNHRPSVRTREARVQLLVALIFLKSERSSFTPLPVKGSHQQAARSKAGKSERGRHQRDDAPAAPEHAQESGCCTAF